MLWFFGSSLLHTGVLVNNLNREYAFGGHDRPGMSGVYWTKPHVEPPGGTFRCEILQGFTFRSDHEIEAIIREVSQKFLGPSYNLLSNNCNHFTTHLCERLTGKAAPSWINRAAGIGVALPCVVPREWIVPPDHDTADGELLEEDVENEHASMLRHGRHRSSSFGVDFTEGESTGWTCEREQSEESDGKSKGSIRDTDRRNLSTSERAPHPQ